MTKQEAVDFFGGTKELAHVAGVWPHTIYKWEEVPIAHQYLFYVKSEFKLIPGDMVNDKNIGTC